jgi:predicted nucleic acid-binding protein
MYCVDASVIVNAQLPPKPYSSKSKAFLDLIKKGNTKVFLPEAIIPEIISALKRATENSELAYQFAMSLKYIPNFSFVPVDNHLANLVASIVSKTSLKGTDAIYVALALDYNLELITLDKDQLERSKGIIKVRKP